MNDMACVPCRLCGAAFVTFDPWRYWGHFVRGVLCGECREKPREKGG